MTSNEVINALECCMGGDFTKSQVEYCGKCPYFQNGNCTELLKKNALKLIKYQEAEINHYKINLPYLEHQNEDFCGVPCSFMENLVEKAKAEAIKEFANKLESRLANNTDITNFEYQSVIGDIINLVKEMVGDNNA